MPQAPVQATTRRLPLEERRGALLELGIELFGEMAYDRLSTDEVAERAGISKGLLYHYFRGKRDFYVCTLREIAERFLQATLPPARGGRVAALRATLHAVVEFVEANPGIYRAMTHGGLGADAEAEAIAAEVRAVMVERIRGRLDVQADDAALALALHGFVGFVESTCLRWLEGRSVSRNQLVEMYVAAFRAIVNSLGDAATSERARSPAATPKNRRPEG